jgi:tripartite-type tricarboxylate transporter receptor subunit TctC
MPSDHLRPSRGGAPSLGRLRSPRALAGLLALGFALAGLPRPAASQAAWPDRPIRLLVPFAPGGVTDSIARLSAEWLSARLGQSVVVENRSGGNGTIALEAVRRSAPDGYTLLTASASQMVMLPALTTVPFVAERDFAPVSIVASNPLAIGVSANLGVRTLGEFVALAKRQGGQLNYGSASTGSSTHLVMALLLQRAGIEMQHVPYRGGSPAMQDLLGGRLAAYFGNASDMIPHVQGDAIRVLAVSGAERSPAMPQVPTVAEQGYPGFRAETWNGIAAPAGVPVAIIDRIAGELKPACADAGFREKLERLGTTAVCSTPAEFAAAMRADAPIWQEAVRISGASLD